MDERNAAWLMFEITGKVDDYLKYCGYKERVDEFRDGRDSHESKKIISREPEISNDTYKTPRFN